MMQCVQCELQLLKKEGKMKDYSKANVEVPYLVHQISSMFPTLKHINAYSELTSSKSPLHVVSILSVEYTVIAAGDILLTCCCPTGAVERDRKARWVPAECCERGGPSGHASCVCHPVERLSAPAAAQPQEEHQDSTAQGGASTGRHAEVFQSPSNQ